MPFSTRDAKSVAATMGHSDVVVNMIGKHYLTKHIVPTRKANGKINRINYDFEEVHVTIPRLLARQARESGVTCFIHVSGKTARCWEKYETGHSFPTHRKLLQIPVL